VGFSLAKIDIATKVESTLAQNNGASEVSRAFPSSVLSIPNISGFPRVSALLHRSKSRKNPPALEYSHATIDNTSKDSLSLSRAWRA